jgi:hypothetical protein
MKMKQEDGQIFQEDEGKFCVRWRNRERIKATNFFYFFIFTKKKRMMTWGTLNEFVN